MGMLVGGRWVEGEVRTDEKGEFHHETKNIQCDILAQDVEAGRFILITQRACPWAHRTVIALHAKGLCGAVQWVEMDMSRPPWRWAKGLPFECSTPLESVEGHPPGMRFLWQLYALTDPNITIRATVPVLWDRRHSKIVSNDSSHILRLFDNPTILGKLGAESGLPLYFSHSKETRSEIDRVNQIVFEGLNDGVYKAGLASSDDAHVVGAMLVEDTLRRLRQCLSV
mmetsp:Transcript_47203/g.151510  ORF Transcript_47203/g.151510 Transcript_47203/m.151510 type:complete len:226 (+) Transcript_47203:69-746(+)